MTNDVKLSMEKWDNYYKKKIDNKKTKKKIGFDPKTSFDQGLIKAINWYKNE